MTEPREKPPIYGLPKCWWPFVSRTPKRRPVVRAHGCILCPRCGKQLPDLLRMSEQGHTLMLTRYADFLDAKRTRLAALKQLRGGLGQDRDTGRFTSLRGCELWRKPRNCEYCGQSFVVKCVQAAKTRFCGRSCSAKWRMRQPEHVAKVHTKETHAKIGRKVSAWLRTTPKGQAHSRRFAAIKPMTMPGMRARVSATLRRMGHRPPWTGGKGRRLTTPQRLLWTALGPAWEAEYAVGVKPRRPDMPSCYFIDLACPERKIAIEVDGATHCTQAVKDADARKTAYLQSFGWTVLRFWNKEILAWVSGEAVPCMETAFVEHGIERVR